MIYYDKNTKIIGKIEDYNKNNNWTKINNELYYYKFFNFNELIGEYLAKYLNLDSVHNKLAIKNNTLYLLTKNFIESKDKYKYVYGRNESFNNLLNRCINEENKNEMINNHMKLFAIDIYMRQSDRYKYDNIMYKIDKETKYISMTKCFDYSNSFVNTTNYSNIYYDIDFNYYELKQLFKLYPSLEYELKKLMNCELYYIICCILSDYKLNIDSKEYLFYEKQEEKSRKILKHIL